MRLTLAMLLAGCAYAESGIRAWLRYEAVDLSHFDQELIPSNVVALNSTKSSPVYTAGEELKDGIESLFGNDAGSNKVTKKDRAVIVGTINAYTKAYDNDNLDVPHLEDDGFYLSTEGDSTLILANNDRGALYGTFEYLSLLAQGNSSRMAYASNPQVPFRWVNQWDNLSPAGDPLDGGQGYMERGYAGDSMFFEDGHVRDDLDRAGQYARIIASIGINALVVNNVNADSAIFKDENLKGLSRLADVFRPYGIQLGLSCQFDSPQDFGVDTSDPLDKNVIAWWNNITDVIYEGIPDMAGYLIKANSEGQPGPLTYNRTLAQGANLFARALRPHNGTVMFRAFIYDADTLDLEAHWRDDRATQAVEFFDGMDNATDSNVVIQIKNGPIDFQVREPVSSIFSHIKKTPSALEVQVTQEYTGQQCHLVYLGPMYKETMDFDFRVEGSASPLSDIINGKVFNRRPGGYAAVVNAGLDETWLGSHLAMSNLYAWGKLAWDSSRDPKDLLRQWAGLTFGFEDDIVDAISEMSMKSWPAFENYTGNLGMLSLADAETHYGPDPASRVFGSIATRAYEGSIGIDRTVSNGSGYAGQYPEEVAQMYEDPDTTPDDLLLFFHHVAYNHTLQSGKTVIQHIYDAHYEGADAVHEYLQTWAGLKGKIDDERFEEVMYRLVYQAGHSLMWRDAITEYFLNLTGISDDEGRVGHHKWRIEAEDMDLNGYTKTKVEPSVAASGGYGIVTKTNNTVGTASKTLKAFDGKFDVAVNYFDLGNGTSTWKLSLNDESVGTWKGDAEDKFGHYPTLELNGVSAMRVTFSNVSIAESDVLKIEGTPDGWEAAPLDYISIWPAGKAD